MKLRDMIRKKKSKAELKETAPIAYGDEEKYPYGLQVSLEKEDIEKLNINIKNFNIDDKVTIMAVADVESLRQSKNRRGEQQNIGFQITKMSVKKRKFLKDVKQKN